jgi:hypothetical protein
MLCRGDRGFPLHHKGSAVVTATTVVDPALLERRISVDRLTPYKLAAGGDTVAALDLYQWNAEVSAAFWVVLGHLEILVRNAMHEQLTALSVSRRTGPDWYLALAGDLSSEACATIADARRHATANGRAETVGRVVAELPFGFWRYLLASRYERTLWRTRLYRAFPGQGRRQAVYTKLAGTHQLRNRIAHHEPIHNRPLARLHDDALLVAEWACPGTRTWIAGRSAVPRLLASRPQPSHPLPGRAAGRVEASVREAPDADR